MDALAPSQEIARHCCPTCGTQLRDQFNWDVSARTFVAGGIAVRFTKFQTKLFDAVWRRRFAGGIENREQFMAMVYGDNANGGPETFAVISVHLAHVRQALYPTGYTITSNYGRPRRGWNLVRAG